MVTPSTLAPCDSNIPCASTNRVWSDEQNAFFNASDGNIMLIASAGSGKTTVTVEKAKRELTKGRKICVLAFGAQPAEELKTRLPEGPTCFIGTFHKLGKQALERAKGNPLTTKGSRIVVCDGKRRHKVREVIADILRPSQLKLYASPVAKLVGYAKSAGVGTEVLPDDWSEWVNLAHHFSLQLEDGADEDVAIGLARKVLTESNNRPDILDFDDMLYLALLRNAPFEPFDVVFVDEAQDTNAVQRALLKKMLGIRLNAGIENEKSYLCDSRLIAVGDPSQAIYGFRGADSDAMTALRDEFQMTVLPLSVSYRCSRAVVAQAQKYETQF